MKFLERELLPVPSETGTTQRKIVVLYGLGGIGKTQLSLAFARAYHRQFSAVLWIDGSSKQSIERSVATIIDRIPDDQISKPKEPQSTIDQDLQKSIHVVMKWLSFEENNEWLLIYDNVDWNPDTDLDVSEEKESSNSGQAYNIDDYIPEADHGRILITTRLKYYSSWGPAWELGVVKDAEAKQILGNYLQRPLGGLATPFCFQN